MTATITTPASREQWLLDRHPTLGGTETPAMLGVHPYISPFKLWAKKRGITFDRDNKQLRRGRFMEPVGIEILREERPDWIVTPNVIGHGGKLYRDLEDGISCTPDAIVQDPGRDGFGAGQTSFGICQIKTVNPHTFQNDWVIDGEIQLPPYVAIQAMQEAHLTGATWACVAAIVGFDLDFHVIDVEMHAGVIARIKREAPEFLRRVRDNDPPPPDYCRDGAAIAAIYDEDDGGVIDFAGRLDVDPYNRLLKLLAHRERIKDIEGAASEAAKVRKTIDAELIHMLGNATRGTLSDGRIVEAKTIRKKGFSVEPTSFRCIKIK